MIDQIIAKLRLCLNECDVVQGTRDEKVFALAVREMASAARFLVASTRGTPPRHPEDVADYEDYESARRELEMIPESLSRIQGYVLGDEAAETLEQFGPIVDELLNGIRKLHSESGPVSAVRPSVKSEGSTG